MKTTAAANKPWDPNADLSFTGDGLHPWLADLDINTVINMSDEEAEKERERYEDNS